MNLIVSVLTLKVSSDMHHSYSFAHNTFSTGEKQQQEIELQMQEKKNEQLRLQIELKKYQMMLLKREGNCIISYTEQMKAYIPM